MLFLLQANCEIEAKDLDEALEKASQHLLAMKENGNSKFLLGGTISVEPIK